MDWSTMSLPHITETILGFYYLDITTYGWFIQKHSKNMDLITSAWKIVWEQTSPFEDWKKGIFTLLYVQCLHWRKPAFYLWIDIYRWRCLTTFIVDMSDFFFLAEKDAKKEAERVRSMRSSKDAFSIFVEKNFKVRQ